MKRFKHILKPVLALAMVILTLPQARATKYDPLAYMDSVEFALVTCSPHEEIYSLYGHTALLCRDLHEDMKQSVAFNWGVFNYEKPHFVARFVFGLTDYELGLVDYHSFCNYYRRWGSSVTEQVLNLSREEKLALKRALEENSREENRIYRYNFFYDNCSTRPRDILERCISGQVVYTPREDYAPTFRQMVHEKVRRHEWAKFGNDMLLGLRADLKTSRQEQEFLPQNLLYDFDHAAIKGSDGSWRPLVSERRMAVKPGVQIVESDFVLSPIECFLLLAAVAVIIFLLEWRRGKTYKYWDAVLMLTTGLAGCVLFVMIFSQHPTTSLNLQLLLVNPIHLFYLPAILRRRKTRYWSVLLTMITLFLIGGLFQHYAEGLMVLALCLLTRFWIHFKYEK
ncbi:MAG: DUF4105 domain-containing protein [Prevotella sp.]|nr:DUF4105 domain-containing protein [Prevotella sp.]MBQ8488122.1 DUF4105 domain-containing protein [Prevotella sp.]